MINKATSEFGIQNSGIVSRSNLENIFHTDLFATNVAHLVLAKTVRSEQIRVENRGKNEQRNY